MQNRVSPVLEESKRSARQRAPGGRRLEFSEGLPLRNRSGCFGETENPPDFGSPAGYGLDESAVFGSSPQPLGPALTGRQVSLRRDLQRSRSYSNRRY